jgi:hypothetical protein
MLLVIPTLKKGNNCICDMLYKQGSINLQAKAQMQNNSSFCMAVKFLPFVSNAPLLSGGKRRKI